MNAEAAGMSGGYRVDVLSRRLADLLATLSAADRQVWLVLPFSPHAGHLDVLLELPGVMGCLVPDIGRQPVTGARVGLYRGKDDWVFPATEARTLIYLGQSRLLRPRRLFEARQRGIVRVIAMDAFGSWCQGSIVAWYARYLVRRLGEKSLESRLVRKLLQVDWWAELKTKHLRSLLSAAKQSRTDAQGKILLVTDNLGPGGAERQVTYTALGLAELGRRVEVFSLKTGTEELDFFRPALSSRLPVQQLLQLETVLLSEEVDRSDAFFDVLRQGVVRRLLAALPAHLADEVLALSLLFLQVKPEVVHLWQDRINIVGGLAAAITGVPRIVLSTRNMAPFRLAYHQPYMAPAYRALAGLDNLRIINNSAAGAADYTAWLGVQSDRIQVVHNGFGDFVAEGRQQQRRPKRADFGIPAHAPVVGSVFRFYQEKDPLLWLETACRVLEQRPDAHFLLVGDGPLKRRVKERAVQLGVDERLHMPGRQENVAGIVGMLDVFLLSSRVEGLPNVLIEAQAMGCPVVSADVGGCAEVLQHGVTGWLVAERSAEALAERVLAVLDDPVWRDAVTEKGPQLVAERFGQERMIRDTLAVYG